jgi:hypothetical protein
METELRPVTGLMPETGGKRKYESTTEINKSLHFGQRKLLMNEIRFLSRFIKREHTSPIVVYVGAAPGHHFIILSELFPQITFHLYDPNPFHKELFKVNKINIHQQYFTDEDTKTWVGVEQLYFISDIRTVGQDDPENVIEQGVWEDNLKQARWVLTINPVAANLKFRLPFVEQWERGIREERINVSFDLVNKENPRLVKYLAGYVFYQPWAKQKSSETRLVPVRNEQGNYYFRVWDSKDYEDTLYYHNVDERPADTAIFRWINPLATGTLSTAPVDPPELIEDYDSMLEALILKEYDINMRGEELPSLPVPISEIDFSITETVEPPTAEVVSVEDLREMKSAPLIGTLPESYKPLEGLLVIYSSTGPCINDDTYDVVKMKKYEDYQLLRLATFKGHDSVLHAMLKTFYISYIEASCSKRVEMVQDLSNDLRNSLRDRWASSFFLKRGKRIPFVTNAAESLLGIVTFYNTTYTNLYEAWTRGGEIGSKLLGYVSESLDVDLYVFKADADNLFLQTYNVSEEKERKAILLIEFSSVGRDSYEPICLFENNTVISFFERTHPFIQFIWKEYYVAPQPEVDPARELREQLPQIFDRASVDARAHVKLDELVAALQENRGTVSITPNDPIRQFKDIFVEFRDSLSERRTTGTKKVKFEE